MLAALCFFSSVLHFISRFFPRLPWQTHARKVRTENEAAILNSLHAEIHSMPFLNYLAPEEETDVWDLLDAGG